MLIIYYIEGCLSPVFRTEVLKKKATFAEFQLFFKPNDHRDYYKVFSGSISDRFYQEIPVRITYSMIVWQALLFWKQQRKPQHPSESPISVFFNHFSHLDFFTLYCYITKDMLYVISESFTPFPLKPLDYKIFFSTISGQSLNLPI